MMRSIVEALTRSRPRATTPPRLLTPADVAFEAARQIVAAAARLHTPEARRAIADAMGGASARNVAAAFNPHDQPEEP